MMKVLVQGQVFLKERGVGGGTFQGLLFFHLEITLLFASAFEEKLFFSATIIL